MAGLIEPSLSTASVGLLNQLLHFLGKSGKTEAMMKLFYKLLASGAEVNFSTYITVLKNLLAAGNWRKYIEVLEWMKDAGVQPSSRMYYDIFSFAQRSAGAEHAASIYHRVGLLKEKSADLALGDDHSIQPLASSYKANEVLVTTLSHPKDQACR